MFRYSLVLVAGVGVLLSGCQKFDESSLVCENQLFMTRQGYYSCCKVRELIYMRQQLERVDVDGCCNE